MAAARVGATGPRLWLLPLLLLPLMACAPEPSPSEQPTAATGPPLLRFHSEVIRLDARRDSLELSGCYLLIRSRALPSPLPIFYPYPDDSRLGSARTLSARWRLRGSLPADTTWLPLPWRELSHPPGALWQLPPGPADTIEVRTTYRQARRGPYARYILTTTQAWGEPLRSAEFQVLLPPDAKNPRCSYPFTGNSGLLTFRATDFLPREDLWVEWSEE
jgi:hypothetical protein